MGNTHFASNIGRVILELDSVFARWVCREANLGIVGSTSTNSASAHAWS